MNREHFPLIIMLSFLMAWSPLYAMTEAEAAMNSMNSTNAMNSVQPSPMELPSRLPSSMVSSSSPEPFPGSVGSERKVPLEMGTLFTDPGIASSPVRSASEAAAIEAKAEAERQRNLQTAIQAVQKRLKQEAVEDIHLSADGRTIIWKVRSAATATAISATAKEVLGSKIKAVKAFEAFNSLLIEMSTPSVENLESILEFIAQVDKPQKQVFIKVLIAEMQIVDSESWGGQLELLQGAINDSGLSGAMSVNHSLSSTPAEAAIRAGFKLFLISGQMFKKFLYAQETNSNFNVLSHPQIVATHGKLAKVTVGQEVNVRKNTTFTEGVVNIEYGKVPIGLSLSVTPYLQSDGVVSMEIVQSLSSLDSYDDTLNLANTSNRLIQTSVSAKIGQTAVLAGIIQKRKQQARSGVPFLSKIPWIGKLFDRSDGGEQKIELLVFLTPEAVQTARRFPVVAGGKKTSVSDDLKNLRQYRTQIEEKQVASGKPSKPQSATGSQELPPPARAKSTSPRMSPAATSSTVRKEPPRTVKAGIPAKPVVQKPIVQCAAVTRP